MTTKPFADSLKTTAIRPSPRDTVFKKQSQRPLAYERAGRSFYVKEEKLMKVENGVRIMAGTMVLISALLTALLSKWWLLLTCFVGINLIQSAFTGICPTATILRKLGLEE
jgi:hypothetical protein